MKHAPREHQRVYLTFYLRIYEGKDFIGFLIDVSRDGLMVMSDFLLEKDKDYTFKMKLPSALDWEELHGLDKYITFSATCRWSKHDQVDQDLYISGFEFSQLGDAENRFIRKLIEEYRMR